MPSPRKPGLGKTLAEILSQNAQRIDEARFNPIIPATLQPPSYEPEDLQDYVIIPRADRNRPKADIPEDFEPLDDAEYAPYPVERVSPDTDPSLYGQGPNKSTRVAAHKFVPYGRLMNRSMGDQKGNAAGIKYGAIYIKFQNNGNIYRYDHVPDHVYQDFRNNHSKGNYINDHLNNYSYAPAANDANASDL